MQFALQLRIDPDKVIPLTIDKIWELLYGFPREKPLNAMGNKLLKLRSSAQLMSRSDLEKIWRDSIFLSINSAKENLNQAIENIKNDFNKDKILCFSKFNDSILMWSYYANNHSGIVLEFTDKTFNNPLKTARPVKYVAHMPNFYDDDLLSDTLAGYKVVNEEMILDKMVWTKSDHWKHENEWRIHVGRGRTNESYEDIKFGKHELSGVILGARIKHQDAKEIIGIVKKIYPHVQLRKCHLDSSQYKINIQSNI
ncbi:MAG: DUF2971 domain-containing protein [Asticcacaulis sp.]|uniref:DUF2971 domain-containing protein n=1 Tax=Asticcacaulis sp. TaxID=1872648 RepID=UPI003F7BB0EF